MFVTLTDLPLQKLVEMGPILEKEGVISRTQHEMLVAVASGKIPPYAFPQFEHLGLKHLYMSLLSSSVITNLSVASRDALTHGWTPSEVGHALKQRDDADHPLNKRLRWLMVQIQQGKHKIEQLG